MIYSEIFNSTEFKNEYLFKKPYAKPGAAEDLRKLIGWPLLFDIFSSNHRNCWLAREGRLSLSGQTGQLDLEKAQTAFGSGDTIVVRHSEEAHSSLREIAQTFASAYSRPVDIQLYATPAGYRGFDWHYDLEDVFVFQSSGVKEFRLRENARKVPVAFSDLPRPMDLASEMHGREQRCVLKAGDFLYISVRLLALCRCRDAVISSVSRCRISRLLSAEEGSGELGDEGVGFFDR